VHLKGEVAHQISRVLRLRLGDDILLLDGRGYEYNVKLAEFGKAELWGNLTGKRLVDTEPAHHVTLYMALLNKSDKFEWALQKCTELGASRFVPVVAERSVTSSGRGERWERIIQEAAEQSGRAFIPELTEPLTLLEALQEDADLIKTTQGSGHISIIPSLGEDISLAKALSHLDASEGSVHIFIGPEGGFTQDELNAADDSGVLRVTLGPRVLRSETAAVAALTMVMFGLGQMGGNNREDRENC
jgi:16S rRNA (uracil1498-N3)-methyltransferase